MVNERILPAVGVPIAVRLQWAVVPTTSVLLQAPAPPEPALVLSLLLTLQAESTTVASKAVKTVRDFAPHTVRSEALIILFMMSLT